MDKLLFCVARGRPEFAQMALGLARSLALINDRTPRAIMTDIKGVDWNRYFDVVVEPPGPRSALDKLLACEILDVDKVLSIDVDILAFKRLDPIFEYCAGKDFAVQGFWDSKGSFHGKPVPDLLQQYELPGQFPRFNGGMAYYERGQRWNELLDRMKHAEANYESLGFELFRRGYASEEVCMLDAMLRGDQVDLIDPDLQFQHSLSGLVGKLHLDIEQNVCHAVCKADKLEYAEPYLFHAWRYKDFRIYWDQLRKLRKLEQKADRQPPEYLPTVHGWRRSFERRWVKNVRKWN